MANPFEIVARRLGELGVYDFLLPWMITSALIWGLLQKAKLFGEGNQAIHAVLSFSVSFFIWGFLTFTGVGLGATLSKFFTQIMLVGIGFSFILLVGSLFFPDFSSALKEKLPDVSLFWIVFTIGMIIAIGAGLLNISEVIYNVLSVGGKIPGGDVGLLMVSVIVLVVLLMIVTAF